MKKVKKKIDSFSKSGQSQERMKLDTGKTKFSMLAIGQKIRTGRDFTVGTERERKAALAAARFLGVAVATRAVEDGFRVCFLRLN